MRRSAQVKNCESRKYDYLFYSEGDEKNCVKDSKSDSTEVKKQLL